MSANRQVFVSVHVTPEARDELRRVVLDLTSPAGRHLSMSDVLIQAIRVGRRHQDELTEALATPQGQADK